ncbi:MAG: GNAT family N-acetyltransferase [Thermoguttaceae bacterium]|jgi:ribosomal protein S18 acetylase RimI-like enzyme
MLTYRAFRNTDPPAICSIWRSRGGQARLFQPVSTDLLEQHVYAKLYFDYPGLILAWEGGQAVGFAHAGFGSTDTGDGVSTELGTTYVVLTRPDCDEAAIARGLLERCEDYLRRRGAKVLYGGGIQPLSSFYLGLYGGSDLPGVLESDVVAQGVYASAGYREIDRTILLQRDLSTFEATVDRRQMQIRRQMLVEIVVDPPSRNWWEACTLGAFDLIRLEIVPRSGGPAVAAATFRDMDLLPVTARPKSLGLIDVWVEESFRRRGVAMFLLGEAFRHFFHEGVTTIEIQTMQHNVAALGLYHKLGFQQVAHGSVLRKET